MSSPLIQQVETWHSPESLTLNCTPRSAPSCCAPVRWSIRISSTSLQPAVLQFESFGSRIFARTEEHAVWQPVETARNG